MLRRIHIEGVGPAPKLTLDLAPRLNLLTGDNGVGKSFLLDIAWWALTGDWGSNPAWPDPGGEAQPLIKILGEEGGDLCSHFVFQKQSWEEIPPIRTPSIVLYAHVDGAFSVWDSARYDDPYHFSKSSLFNGLTDKQGIPICEGLIRDWVSWQRQKTRSFRQLVKVLSVLSPGDEEQLKPGTPLRVNVDDVRDHPTLEMPYGEVPLIYSSAGMQRVIGFAYLLVWAWQEHVQAVKLLRRPEAERIVFLIDEMESHLHPKWQRLLMPALLSVASSVGSQADVQILATTHSPLVLASVEPVFDEDRDKLIHLQLDSREVHIEEVAWAKQGDAANWLVSEVFGLQMSGSSVSAGSGTGCIRQESWIWKV